MPLAVAFLFLVGLRPGVDDENNIAAMAIVRIVVTVENTDDLSLRCPGLGRAGPHRMRGPVHDEQAGPRRLLTFYVNGPRIRLMATVVVTPEALEQFKRLPPWRVLR